jgi:hypothetical protein
VNDYAGGRSRPPFLLDWFDLARQVQLRHPVVVLTNLGSVKPATMAD